MLDVFAAPCLSRDVRQYAFSFLYDFTAVESVVDYQRLRVCRAGLWVAPLHARTAGTHRPFQFMLSLIIDRIDVIHGEQKKECRERGGEMITGSGIQE